MKTRSIRPWCRRVVKGYRASMKLGHEGHVPVLWMPLPFCFGSQKATSYTLAGVLAMIARLRPMFRSRSRERGWIPSARPVTVGSGRMSMCLILYPHLARQVDSSSPTGPAPMMTMSYLACLGPVAIVGG